MYINVNNGFFQNTNVRQTMQTKHQDINDQKLHM